MPRPPRPVRRGRRAHRLALLASVAILGLGAIGIARGEEDASTAAPVPDYAFYVARVAPIVERLCMECHADPRRRREVGRHVLVPVPGRRIQERHHRRNYETILGLVVPGNPAASPWILKPLGPDQGGVQHGGGRRIAFDGIEYGTMVDFVNGVRYEAPPFRVPPTEPGAPDFRFFVDRVQPVLLTVCAECHGEQDRGAFRQLLVPEPGTELGIGDAYENFRTVLELVDRGHPERSRFLLKPLAEQDGGIRHKGGDRIFAGDARHAAWTAFLRGEVGPPLPSERSLAPPTLEAGRLLLEAEDLVRRGELAVVDDPAASGRRLVAPDGAGGLLTTPFRIPGDGVYEVEVRLRGPGAPVTFVLDRAPPESLAAPGEGFQEVGPRRLLDGKEPLLGLSGRVEPGADALHLAGEGGRPARFVSPAEVDHQAVEAVVRLPAEDEGGEDAWLLFDLDDPDNGKLLGLADGGRRLVMGLLEGGVPRILDSAPAPEAEPGAERTLRVEYLDGVAVGRLDGRPLVFLHLDRQLGQGLFGALAHGAAEVLRLSAFERWEVHRVEVGRATALPLSAGLHVLGLQLPPDGAAVDAVEIRVHR